jgi:lysophospholipase L1-like esterase
MWGGCVMKTVFVGDSLTEGIPGVSYWRFLKNKKDAINRGVGGDTLLGASKRIGKMLVSNRYDSINKYIIEIGTNDVLLQTLVKHSYWWQIITKAKGSILGCVPCDDIIMFREKYEELLLTLLHHNKKIGIIGLPMIENSVLKINEIMEEYDLVIRTLAGKYNIDYVNLRKLEKDLKGDNEGSYFFGKTTLGNIIDTIFTSFLPFSNIVSKLRGLSVTIDSVHLNRKTAKRLAKEIEGKLL